MNAIHQPQLTTSYHQMQPKDALRRATGRRPLRQLRLTPPNARPSSPSVKNLPPSSLISVGVAARGSASRDKAALLPWRSGEGVGSLRADGIVALPPPFSTYSGPRLVDVTDNTSTSPSSEPRWAMLVVSSAS